MRRSVLGSFLFLLALVCLFDQRAWACQCLPLPPVYEAFNEASAVFVGKVIGSNVPTDKSKYDGKDIVFDIEVIESFKGPKGKVLKLNLGSMARSCYAGYSVGSTVLFYANTSRYDGTASAPRNAFPETVVYQTNFCNRSNSIDAAQDQLSVLRRLVKGEAQPQIYGSVGLREPDPDTGSGNFKFRQNIEVRLEGERTYKTITDANGLFEFGGIPPGEYTLVPRPPAAFELSSLTEPDLITVLSDRSVVYGRVAGGFGNKPYSGFYSQFILRWNNTIRGNVVDSKGTGLERFVVSILPLAKANDPIKPTANGSPDHHLYDGFFVFGGFAPGKYVIAVDVHAPSGSGKRRFFFPNVNRVVDAEVLTISERSSFPDFRVTLPIAVRKIEGEMVWSDGTSVGSRGHVQLKRLDSRDEFNNFSFDWGSTKEGRFDLEAIEGNEYWIAPTISYSPKVRSGAYARKELVGKPRRIAVGPSLSKVKIVFEKPADFSCEKLNDCSP